MIELCNNCGLGLPCDCGYVPGAPRNPPLPDNSLSEAFVQTQAEPDVEKLLSDALTLEGNDSTWGLTNQRGTCIVGRGTFISSGNGFRLIGPGFTIGIWATAPDWEIALQEEYLTLVSAPGIQPTDDATQTGTKPEGAL